MSDTTRKKDQFFVERNNNNRDVEEEEEEEVIVRVREGIDNNDSEERRQEKSGVVSDIEDDNIIIQGPTGEDGAQHVTATTGSKHTTTREEEKEEGKEAKEVKRNSRSNIPISRGLRRSQEELESKERESKNNKDRDGPGAVIVAPSNLVAMRGLRKNSHHTKGSHHTENDSPTTSNFEEDGISSSARAVQGIDSQENENGDTNDNLTTTSTSNIEDAISSFSTRTMEVGDDNHHSHNGIAHLIQAYPVLEEQQQQQQQQTMDEIREEVRQNIIQDAVEANVVDLSSSLSQHSSPTRKRKMLFWSACVVGSLLLVVMLSIVFAVILPINNNDQENGSDNNNSDRGTGPMVTKSILDFIRARRYIRCGIYDHAIEFSLLNPTTGKFEGINADQCRAIAAAVLGSSNAVDFVVVEALDRFQLLANGTIDVLATTATHNFQRDVYFGKSTESGFTFTTPFAYSGMTFWGPPDYLHCAESLDSETGICQNLTVCVAALTTHEWLLRTLFPHEAVVPVSTPEKLISKIDDGSCVVVAAENIYTNARRMANHGGVSSGKLFSNEPLSLVTREDDHEWSSLVNLVINVFYLAQANSISKSNAEDLQPLVGPNLSTMLVPVIREFGNYADLYDSHLAPLGPRHGLNMLYTKDDQSGLLYAFPLGTSTAKGPDPDPDGVIARVRDRGYLKCGVVDDRDAVMAGFDIEFCKALSAGLFRGSTEALQVIMMSTTDAAFKALEEGEWDVAAGMRLHVLAGYKGPTAGKGFSLSMPCFYDTTAMQAYGFVTSADDPKWSDLVNWVAMATIHAASMGIGQSKADDMPRVNPFGKNLNLFQDVVRGVGSYNEIYNRTLEAFIPQAGSGNELNRNLTGPQQFPLPFL